MAGLLGNIRVLDLTRVLAGPWCTQTLADMGAEVIKVEHPRLGDDTRHWGPPWLKDGAGEDSDDSTYFACANRNKQSIAIDLSQPDGRALILELAAKSDVFVENFKVGDMARYGLAYDDICKINPAIIYCSITGFGQTGPYASRPAYDHAIQAEAGLMSINGERDDLPGGGPMKIAVSVSDLFTGMYACTAILAAINGRHQTGQGQRIDISLFDCSVAMGAYYVTSYVATGHVPKRQGNAHPNLVPYQVFQTQDEPFVLALLNDQQWQQFCVVLGRNDLEQDERYRTSAGRVQFRNELVETVQDLLLTQTREKWLEALEKNGLVAAPINDYAQVFAHPQAIDHGLHIEQKNAEGVYVATPACPVRFVQNPVEYRRAPPILGEHTKTVLQAILDYSDDDIVRLRDRGIIR